MSQRKIKRIKPPNFVAKYDWQVNVAKVFKDKTKYNRKEKRDHSSGLFFGHFLTFRLI